MDDSSLFLAASGAAALLIAAFFVLVVWLASREARLEAELGPRPRLSPLRGRRRSHAGRR